jgi:hypothetical protein
MRDPHVGLLIKHNFQAAVPNAPSRRYTGPSDGVTLNEDPAVTFQLKNYGPTRVTLMSVSTKMDHGAVAPTESTHYDPVDMPLDRVIGPNDTTAEMRMSLTSYRGGIPRDKFQDLHNGRTYWWFFGWIGFDDIDGGQNRHHFCWRYDFGLRVFEPFPRDRNYTKQNSDPEMERQPQRIRPALPPTPELRPGTIRVQGLPQRPLPPSETSS